MTTAHQQEPSVLAESGTPATAGENQAVGPGGWRAYLVFTIVFGLAHTQAPLYYSNQNQYFLHGLADGGLGFLNEDWLANTADPTPLFSRLVAFTHRYFDDRLFHVYFLLILGLYCRTLVGIFCYLTGRPWSSLTGLCFFTLLVIIHCGLIRLSSTYLFGKDYPWYFQAGVANQYILGPVLQPSVSGLLLLVAIEAYLRGRSWFAVLYACAAAIVHSTYLLSAAFLTVAFMYFAWRHGSVRRALGLGGFALLLVLPVVAYNYWMFAPTSGEAFAQAQQLLARVRIPHHADPWKWCDLIAIAQVAWIAFALWLVRGSELFLLMLVPFLLSVLLTIFQVATNNATLALLFPWRVSAVLVPLATCVMLARLVEAAAPWLERRAPDKVKGILLGLASLLALLVGSGLGINYLGLAYRTSAEELPLMDYVREHKQAGDVYLLPVEVPKLASAPGAGSTSFTPPPKRGRQTHLISVDLLRFRLFTGAPIFVDFKSVPYRDVEVLEWWSRMSLCQRLYGRSDWDRDDFRAALAPNGITHVIAPAHRGINSPDMEAIWGDEYYRVYRLR